MHVMKFLEILRSCMGLRYLPLLSVGVYSLNYATLYFSFLL